jgi:hypothetical protein
VQYQEFYNRAENILASATPEDLREFKTNPYTKALNLMLTGDSALILEEWAAGSFSAESAEGTAQNNAKALGELHAIERVLDHINDLSIEEESVD